MDWSAQSICENPHAFDQAHESALTSSEWYSARLNAARIVLGCRSLQKANAARDSILKDRACKTTTIDVWQLDLADYQSVLSFAKRVQTDFSRLDAFIANAGVELMEFTLAEGLETTLTVNVVSTMLLNMAVLPKLRETSTRFGISTTLTVVGSMVHIFGPPELMKPPPREKDMDTFDMLSDPATADMGQPDSGMSPRYSLSKTLLHAVMPYFAKCASRPDRKEQVVVNWLNPGWCESELARHKATPALAQRMTFAAIGRTAEQGSRTLVHAILAGEQSHGKYLSECREIAESDFLRSEKGVEVRKRLWTELMARIEKISVEIARVIEC